MAWFIAIACFAAGCTFGTRHVDLIYEAGVPSAPAPSRGTIAIARFTDSRPPDMTSSLQVGQARNPFGVRGAPVEADENPVVWVGDALARALAAQGFSVERIDQPSAVASLPIITGSVSKVFIDVSTYIDAEVKANVTIEKRGQQVFSVQCEGTNSAVECTGAAKEYQHCLTGAMQQFIATCLPKLLPQLDATE